MPATKSRWATESGGFFMTREVGARFAILETDACPAMQIRSSDSVWLWVRHAIVLRCCVWRVGPCPWPPRWRQGGHPRLRRSGRLDETTACRCSANSAAQGMGRKDAGDLGGHGFQNLVLSPVPMRKGATNRVAARYSAAMSSATRDGHPLGGPGLARWRFGLSTRQHQTDAGMLHERKDVFHQVVGGIHVGGVRHVSREQEHRIAFGGGFSR